MRWRQIAGKCRFQMESDGEASASAKTVMTVWELTKGWAAYQAESGRLLYTAGVTQQSLHINQAGINLSELLKMELRSPPDHRGAIPLK